MPLVKLTKLCKEFPQPGAEALGLFRDLDFSLESGGSAAIVGPSGCGKSTLLNILGTLDRPQGGSYRFDGEDVLAMDAAALGRLRNQRIGFVFQLHHLLPQCTALENVLLPTLAQTSPLDHTAALQRAEELLVQVGLGERLQSLPHTLSGGERQRVALARALIHRPALLLADEPTGALDERNASLLTELLLELHRAQGMALVLVTHHPLQAQRMGRVLTLEQGQLRS